MLNFNAWLFENLSIQTILLGNVVVLKGMIYYFNVLNHEGSLGKYYDSKAEAWIEIKQKGIKLISNLGINSQPSYTFPIVTIPYIG